MSETKDASKYDSRSLLPHQQSDHKEQINESSTIDRGIDTSEAIRVESGFHQENSNEIFDSYTSNYKYNKEEIKRLTWKRDVRILPLICLFYLFSFLDRVNIGNYLPLINSPHFNK